MVPVAGIRRVINVVLPNEFERVPESYREADRYRAVDPGGYKQRAEYQNSTHEQYGN